MNPLWKTPWYTTDWLRCDGGEQKRPHRAKASNEYGLGQDTTHEGGAKRDCRCATSSGLVDACRHCIVQNHTSVFEPRFARSHLPDVCAQVNLAKKKEREREGEMMLST